MDPSEERPVDYRKEIQPLLQAKCFHCHGDKDRKADLNLSSFQGILKGGESGEILVPGKPDESSLYERIHSGEMPPDEKDQLSPAQIDTIRRWIEQGAKTGMAETVSLDAEAPPNQHDVLPILLRRCTACHGRNRQEGKLDLRSKEAMLRGGKSGPAIVSGKPEESLLIKRVRAGEMPPAERLVEASVKPIGPAEIDTLALDRGGSPRCS